MAVYKGLSWDPTAFSTANGAHFNRTAPGGQGFAWSFIGDGKKYSGVRAHIGSTAGGLGPSLKIKIGIHKCRGSGAGSAYPQNTCIGRACTTRSWVNASVKSWMTFTFGTASGWIATAGTKYWVMASPVSWGSSDLLRFTYFTGYTRKIFAVPSSTAEPGYVFRNFTNNRSAWSATVANIPAMYLVEHTTGTKSFKGWPYHNLQTYTLGRATSAGTQVYLNTSCILSSVAVYVKGGGTSRNLHLSLFSGTNLSFPLSNKIWEATAWINMGSGYGWKTFVGPTTVLPYGYYTFAASSPPNVSQLAIPYVMSENYFAGNHTYLSSTYRGYRKDTFYSTTDSMFRINLASTFTTFYSRVRDWYFNTVQPGAAVTYYYGNTAVAVHKMTSTGWSKFASVAPDRTSKFVPTYGTWIFNRVNTSTPYWSSARMTSVASATFIKGPDTDVPNVATPFAFRQLLLVSSAHTAYPKSYLAHCAIRTGPARIIDTTGHYNEALGPNRTIVYFDNKTHIAWRAEGGEHYAKTYYHATKTLGARRYLSESYDNYDSHFYSNLEADQSGYIHYLHCTHGDPPLYYMFATANDLYSRTIHTGNAMAGTYHAMVASRNNSLFAFARMTTGSSRFGYDLKRRCHTAKSWAGARVLAVSTVYTVEAKNLSWYSNGPFIDNTDTIHLTLTMDENYGEAGVLQYGTHMFYLYSPPSVVSASTTEPGHYWFAANGSVVAVLTNNTTWPMRFRSATAAAAIVATCANSWETRHSDKSFSANLKTAIWANHRQPYTSGGRTNYRPYHAFGVDASAQPAGGAAWISWYNPSAPNANSHGWVLRNLTTAIAYTFGSSVRPWNHRAYGPMLIDHKNIIRVYGSVPKNYKKASAWWGGELFEWRSEDSGATWHGRYLTDRSSIGFAMMDTKTNVDNQLIEIVYTRGREIHYYIDASVFPHFRDDGNDIAVIFSGTATPKVIDSVANYYNFSTSEVVFSLHTSIPKNYPCSTAGQYYIYYGRRTSTPLASDPRNIYLLYENFEQGNQLYSTSLFASQSSNPNSWNYFEKMPYWGGTSIPKSAWRITGSYQTDPISTLRGKQHTNKIAAGGRALWSWVGTSSNLTGVTTCYVYTAVPVKFRRGIAVEGSIWYEDVNTGSYLTGMIGFTVGTNHTVLGVKVYDGGRFGYFTGTEFRSTPQTAVATEGNAGLYRMIDFKAQIVGTAFTCYANRSATAIGYVKLPYQCSAQRVILCRTNQTSRSQNHDSTEFYDYIKIYPAYPD